MRLPNNATFTPRNSEGENVMDTSAVLTQVLEDDPDSARHLAQAYSAAWEISHRRQLELCRLRVAMLLGCDFELGLRTPKCDIDETTVADLSRWPSSELFDSRDRVCLAFCEQFVVDVAGLDDATARAVSSELGEQGLADFVSALLVVEQRQRLRLAWERLL